MQTFIGNSTINEKYVKCLWNGFEKVDFKFEGRDAVLVFPHEENKIYKWLMKMEYWDAFPNFEVEMLKRGWHLAYIKNQHRWCMDEDLNLKQRFADYLILHYGLEKKFVPVGMSCGGMFSVKFTAKFPEYVSALYLAAPVMNLLSCPGDFGIGKSNLWEEFYKITGKSKSEMICYREHPMDKIDILLENKIPVVMIYGEDDLVVPYSENGALLEMKYKKNDCEILVIGKENCGHHPHGLINPEPVIEFINNLK